MSEHMVTVAAPETDRLIDRYRSLLAVERQHQLDVAIARAVLQVDADIQDAIAASEARMRARGVSEIEIEAVRRLQAESYAVEFPRVGAQIRDIFTREFGGGSLLTRAESVR